MELEELKNWVKRLIEINKELKNNKKPHELPQRINQLVGYIESLEHIDFDK